MRVVTFKIEEELLSDLDHYCYIRNTVRSDVIRKAIKWYLDRERSMIITRRLKIYPNIRVAPQRGEGRKRGRRRRRKNTVKPVFDYDVV